MATIPNLSDVQRQQLLDAQFEKAMDGSEALQIHLGRAYLNQHEKQHLIVEAIPFTDRTVEELLELLEQRSQEISEPVLLEQVTPPQLPQAAAPERTIKKDRASGLKTRKKPRAND